MKLTIQLEQSEEPKNEIKVGETRWSGPTEYESIKEVVVMASAILATDWEVKP